MSKSAGLIISILCACLFSGCLGPEFEEGELYFGSERQAVGDEDFGIAEERPSRLSEASEALLDPADDFAPARPAPEDLFDPIDNAFGDGDATPACVITEDVVETATEYEPSFNFAGEYVASVETVFSASDERCSLSLWMSSIPNEPLDYANFMYSEFLLSDGEQWEDEANLYATNGATNIQSYSARENFEPGPAATDIVISQTVVCNCPEGTIRGSSRTFTWHISQS